MSNSINETTANRRPDRVFKAGQIEASIWREPPSEDRPKSPRFSVRIRRQYWDEFATGYRVTDYFNFPADIADLILVAQKAYEFVRLGDQANSSNDGTSPA